ncbi:hypothetical protein KY328_02580 [Candidatus Woesearchaeota archaeon]|nr:hypothetical protein [Candidatus Woesearchaeota archaeon]MBW3021778.1 hypothetical protein [Candidatus Woesearchaeota archaeon]
MLEIEQMLGRFDYRNNEFLDGHLLRAVQQADEGQGVFTGEVNLFRQGDFAVLQICGAGYKRIAYDLSTGERKGSPRGDDWFLRD